MTNKLATLNYDYMSFLHIVVKTTFNADIALKNKVISVYS